jgi:subtilisin
MAGTHPTTLQPGGECIMAARKPRTRISRQAPPRPAPTLTSAEGRRPVIVTFKPKEKRRDKTSDKVEIVTNAVPRAESIHFYDVTMAAEFAIGSPGLPASAPVDQVGYDVNLYEAPIVTLSLSDAEIKALHDDPNVATVEEDGVCYALPVEQLVFEGQPSVLAETVPIGVHQIKAPLAWGCSRGKGVRVSVLDTGIDWNHPDLSANVKGAVSFVPGETAMDGHSHGTHCAGTIGAAINGIGVVGVAPEASLYAVKVLANNGSGNWSWLIAGLNWCIQNRIHIASMSLGGGGAPAALEAMCNAAFQRGVLLVAAAGNSGPAMGTVGFPGKYRNVIAVSAIDNNNVMAGFSSRGPEVELCAPGVQVLSTVPGGGYGTFNGTSMACPHVAGSAAVTWGAHRFANNVTIWNLLGSTADDFGPLGWDPEFGYGRVDPDQAAMQFNLPPAVPLKP